MIRLAAGLTLALACPAGAFDLAFPADCTLGETCYIQQYYDQDPGEGASDFTCGPLSYDGHDGTDIAVPTRAAMEVGVNVLAAAAGLVTGTRDGVADFAPFEPGKECGNGVVIDHGQGWATQYCHMKQGSVVAKPGQRVEAGAVLGMIGQSGMAEFPHLHLSVREGGQEVDPFALDASACGPTGADLWAIDPVIEPGGLLAIGISDQVPEYEAIKAGLASPDLPGNAPALVVWTYGFGFRAGDAILLSLTGPGGQIVTERVVMEKTQALAFRAVGRKLKAAAWPPGDYVAAATLIRDRAALDRQTIHLAIGP